jgi:toxin ParE1/3/4
MPERGRLRNDLGIGVHTLSFRRRAVIAYRLEGEVIMVLRLFYAGQDLGSA